MVAPLGFLEHLQIRVLVFLPAPRRAVDALQLFVGLVAAPIRAGNLRQLEHLQLARRRHVRAAAQIDETTFAIQRNVFVRRNRRDDLGLVLLADRLEKFHRVVALPDFAHDRLIFLRELGHFLFDRRQIFRRKRTLVGEVVIKAVLDHGADRDLRFRKQLLDRIREQMCR